MAASSLDHPHFAPNSLRRELPSSSSFNLSLSLSLPNQHLQFNKLPPPPSSSSPVPSTGNTSGDGAFLTLAPPTAEIHPAIEKVSGFPAENRAPRRGRKRAPYSVPKPKRTTFRESANPWTEEEDEELKSIVGEMGDQQWMKIGEMMRTRTGKQCRERWKNQLRPDIKKSTAWTNEEEEIIIQMHKQEGAKWVKISKRLPGRTENSVKNHWNSTKRKVANNGVFPESSPLQHYIGANSGPAPGNLLFKDIKNRVTSLMWVPVLEPIIVKSWWC